MKIQHYIALGAIVLVTLSSFFIINSGSSQLGSTINTIPAMKYSGTAAVPRASGYTIGDGNFGGIFDTATATTMCLTGDDCITSWTAGGGNAIWDDDALTNIFMSVKDPTGFENTTDSTIAFDDGTRTFTITPVGSFEYFILGTSTVVSSPDSVVIDDTSGTHFIYYDDDGLATSTTPWSIVAGDKAFVAAVYWNSTSSKGTLLDERHGISMSQATHNYLHHTRGTAYDDGLTGSFTDPATWELTTGSIHDEDLEFDIEATSTTKVFYRNGDYFTWTDRQSSLIVENAGVVQYDNNNVLTDVPAANYVAYWVYAINDPVTPIMTVMGQRVDTTIANAQANNTVSSLDLLNIPSVEAKLLYRVIVKRNGTAETVEDVTDFRQTQALGSSDFTANDHGALSGLLDDDHTQYLLADGSRALTANWDAGSNSITASTFVGSLTGNADTATALAANGANCDAGSYPLGVDASGAVESCTDATTEIDSAITTHAGDNDAHQALVTLAGTPDYLTLSGQEITLGTVDIGDDTNLAVGGTLLDLTGDTLSVNEGTLTNTYLCTYVTGTGLQCNTDPDTLGGAETDPIWIASSSDYARLDGATFSGDATFNNSIYASQYIYHEGDVDTNLNFSNDVLWVNAGNLEMIAFREGTTDRVVINDASADIDFRVESNTDDDIIFVNGGSNTVDIAGANFAGGGIISSATWNGNAVDISSYTNLAVGGTLLDLTGDTLSVNEGTLTNNYVCTYVTGTGLVCNTDPTSLGSGTVNTATSSWVAFYDSTGTAVSGTSTLVIVDNKVGIGTTSPSAVLEVDDGVTGTTTVQFGDASNVLCLAIGTTGDNIVYLTHDGNDWVTSTTDCSQ